MRDWTVAQHFAICIGLFTTVTGLIGMAINPDFAVRHSRQSRRSGSCSPLAKQGTHRKRPERAGSRRRRPLLVRS
jgi:hypothetical protein